MHSLSVIDVGHGNCAIISSGEINAVVDAGSSIHLMQYLEENNITNIDLVVISHADKDHIEGLIKLLGNSSITVKNLVLNPDAGKRTKLWDDIRALVDRGIYQGKIVWWPAVYADGPNAGWADLSDRLRFEVISPSAYVSMSAAGGAISRHGGSISSNAASIVVKLSFDGRPIALFAADMDELSLKEITRVGKDMAAPFLIFPHHGGNPGAGSVEAFTKEILAAVRPTDVIFSNARGGHGNPKPEIVKAVHEFDPSIQISCTQLSRVCCSSAAIRPDFKPRVYSAGHDSNGCCAGSIVIDLESCSADAEQSSVHAEFVRQLPDALCMSHSIIIARE